MGKLKQGSVTVTFPDDITLPEKAGKLSPEELSRLEKPRRGIGMTCEKTAEALKKNPDRLAVPGLDPDALADAGRMAEDIDSVISDLEYLMLVAKQANSLLDSHAHRELRKVLAVLRSQEKFDTNLAELFQPLVTYFSNNRGGSSGGTPPGGGAPPGDDKPS